MAKTKAKTGRIGKCTPEVTKKVVEALNAGNFFKVACQFAGIGESTGLLWLKTARDEGHLKKNEHYKAFADAVHAVNSSQEVAAVALWRKAFAKDWRAIESFLKRRFPDRWGDRASLEHTGAKGGPIRTLDLSKLSDDQLEFLKDNAALLEVIFGQVSDAGGDPEGAGAPESEA